MSVLRSEQITSIRRLYKEGYAMAYLARKFCVNPFTIMHHVFDLIPPNKTSPRRRGKLMKSEVLEIRRIAVNDNVSCTNIAKQFNISSSTALSVVKGKTYRWCGGPTIPHPDSRYKLKKSDIVYLVPVDLGNIIPISDKRYGPNPGARHIVKLGTLVRLSKKYGVVPCTISKWIRKGKIIPNKKFQTDYYKEIMNHVK